MIATIQDVLTGSYHEYDSDVLVEVDCRVEWYEPVYECFPQPCDGVATHGDQQTG